MIGLISEEPAEDKKKAKVDEKLKPSMGAGTYVKDFENKVNKLEHAPKSL